MLIGVTLGYEEYKTLKALRKELRGRPYEESMLDLIKAAHDYEGEVTSEDLSSLFCSELVAECYQRLGLLDEKKASDEYVPGDFGEQANLQLLRGHLGVEYHLS